MLFTAHVANTGPLKALRRRTPRPAKVPGLRSARTATCAPFTPGFFPHPQLGREAMVACWEDEASLDRFLTDHPTGQMFASGWGARMELFRAVGVWPGLDEDMVAAADATPAPATGPTIAITIGTFYARKLASFLRVNASLEEQFLEAPNALWGTGMTNLPQRLIGTLTIWDNPTAAENYMRNGAHSAAVKAHYDPTKDPTGHTFVTGGGFFGFRPISVNGTLEGKNPMPSDPIVA